MLRIAKEVSFCCPFFCCAGQTQILITHLRILRLLGAANPPMFVLLAKKFLHSE